ncbi:MAG: DUF3306 domain-containing protein [Gammaproteobacteria bacterium]|nr:DUF3306 domain-containing protein [Gammaproteobacteria bacterium]
MSQDDNEAVLSRWSRRKLQNQQISKMEPPVVDQTPVEPVLTDADMPAIETLDESSDFSAFMSSGVSDKLRNLALRKMFQTPAFNIRDGLDEYDEDFTSFEKLGDIVTCDMKHRIEMQENKKMYQTNADARDAALSIVDGFETRPTSLISYQSGDRVIAIGDNNALTRCMPGIKIPALTLVSTSGKLPDSIANFHIKQRDIRIQGYLGAFKVELDNTNQTLQADIVLDLCEEPINQHEVLPPGYLHLNIAEQNQQAIETQVVDLVGEFQKPKYFNYDPSICAHAVNGVTVCSHCIDACPAAAIHSRGEQIEVTPFLCQGGGTCASVCPSGAIQYAYPCLADSGNQLRMMLQAYRQQQGGQAIVMFHSQAFAPQDLLQLHGNLLPLRVEELGSVGMELCLSAFAYGASQVVLMADDAVPVLSLKQLNRQLEWLQVLLRQLGMKSQQLSIQSSRKKLVIVDDAISVEASEQGMPEQKRNAMYQALDHLVAKLNCDQVTAELPAGVPFGSVLIDESKCTLCMSCVGACPGRALQDGSNREVPELFLIEGHCIQCGACSQTCPELAITLIPQLILDRENRNRGRVLNRDEAFACIECGKPFAPSSVIGKMQGQLKEHPMFDSVRALDRLKMCGDCRVTDIVQDSEALKGDFDPLK